MNSTSLLTITANCITSADRFITGIVTLYWCIGREGTVMVDREFNFIKWQYVNLNQYSNDKPGAFRNGVSTGGKRTKDEGKKHINVLELKEVTLAILTFTNTKNLHSPPDRQPNCYLLTTENRE